MSDINTAAAPVAAPAPAAPAPVADELAALKQQIAALTAKLDAPPPPPAPGVAHIVWGAGVRAWWASVEAVAKTYSGMKLVYGLLDGLKTLLVFSVTGALALMQEFEAIDLTPLISKFIPDGAHLDVATVITLMSVLGILLRIITKSPLFRRASAAVDGGATDSKVDTPAGG